MQAKVRKAEAGLKSRFFNFYFIFFNWGTTGCQQGLCPLGLYHSSLGTATVALNLWDLGNRSEQPHSPGEHLAWLVQPQEHRPDHTISAGCWSLL